MPNNNSIDEFSSSNATIENDSILDIGLKVEKSLLTANSAFSGIIMTFYAGTVGCLIIISFMCVGTMGLNEKLIGSNKLFFAGALFLATLMHLMRLYIIMDSAQTLGNEIKKTKRVLEEIMIRQEYNSSNEFKNTNKMFVLRKRLEVYQLFPPISPFSVVSLGHRTFGATLATIITYIVVLIKLRGLETSQTCPPSILMNDTVTE